MYQRVIAFCLCLFMILSTELPVYAQEPPKESELYAKAAVLIDGDSGRMIYEKNGFEALANASTTKILTCIIALEKCDLESEVCVSSYASSQPKVHLGMREGQTFYLKDMLYGLMLESFNDCAVVIAEHIAGDVSGFAKLMNQKATEIGCEDTYFITPNGLDGKDDTNFHHTTAADLAKIMRYCIKQSPKAEQFLQITGTKMHSFCDLERKHTYNCYNHNAFLDMMDGAISGKTGFTGTAGYCYVGALQRDNRTFIVALLACGWPNNKTYKWSDTKKLMNYGIENFYVQNLNELQPDRKMLSPIVVKEGQSNCIGGDTWIEPVVKDYSGCPAILLAESEKIDIHYEIAEQLLAPVERGTYVGRITYLLGDEVLGEYQVLAGNSVERIDFLWCLKRVAECYWLDEKRKV